MKVKLTKEECLIAAMTGVQRRIFSMGRHIHRDLSPSSSGFATWDADIEAAGAELAAAKAMGIYWQPRIGNLECSDLDDGCEVRHTRRSNGRLIIRPGDKEGMYVLVTGIMPNYTVAGYMTHREAREKYSLWVGPAGTGEEAYWVPQEDLKKLG